MIRINILHRCGETLTIELESWGLEAWVDD